MTWSGPTGYIQSIDEDQLLAYVVEQGRDGRLRCAVGHFLLHGAALLEIPAADRETMDANEAGLSDVLRTGAERTMSEDPTFGFRQLVDVALRALSPSLNDSSTAGQAIDRLHELLRQLQACAITSPRTVRAGEGPSLEIPAPDWSAYVHLAVAEITEACRSLPRVTAQLREMLGDLLEHATEEQRPALKTALASLELRGAGD